MTMQSNDKIKDLKKPAFQTSEEKKMTIGQLTCSERATRWRWVWLSSKYLCVVPRIYN